MHKNKSGFSLIALGLLITTLGVIGFAGYGVYKNQNKKNSQGQTEQKKTFVVLATSDVACPVYDKDYNSGKGQNGRCQHNAVVDAMSKEDADLVILSGDIDQDNGALDNYKTSFIPAYKKLNFPVMTAPGNHDYVLGNVDGYKQAIKEGLTDAKNTGPNGETYHSLMLGTWKLMALDANCEYIGGCDESSPEGKWLKSETEQLPKCSLAFWHQPRFTTGLHNYDASTIRSKYFWDRLYDSGNDLVVNGHDHQYQRFGSIDKEGNLQPSGMREIISGTGGFSLRPYDVKPHPSLEKGINNEYGYTRLTLSEGSYEWEFKDVAGNVLDSGEQGCR